MGSVQTALITGASSGIGRELAKLFHRDGYQLILVGRDQDRLAALKKELLGQRFATIHLLFKDLAHPSAGKEIAQQLHHLNLRVDVLVNCAGLGTGGPFTHTAWNKERDIISVNITALTELTKYLLPHMVNTQNGKILNVASTAAFQPGPFMAVYYASKAYVLSFSQALSEELRETGVTVTTLCPGPITTHFMQGEQAWRRTRTLLTEMTAAEVARIGYQALHKKKRVVICGVSNKILHGLTLFIPGALLLRIMRFLVKPRG